VATRSRLATRELEESSARSGEAEDARAEDRPEKFSALRAMVLEAATSECRAARRRRQTESESRAGRA
jgi:hypothetical protein